MSRHHHKQVLQKRPAPETAVPSMDVALEPHPESGTQVPFEWLRVFDQIADPIFVHDKEFRILRCNAAYAKCAEQPMEAILGMPYWLVFPKTPKPPENSVDNGGINPLTEVSSGTGEVFLTHDITAYRDSGEFWYSRHLMANITARKLLDDKERLKSSFSSAIIESAPGVFVVLDNKHRLVRWNADLNTLTGRSDVELQDAHLLDCLPEANRDEISAKLSQAFETGQANAEFCLNCTESGLTNYAFSARRFEADGEFFVVSFWMDQTAEKRFENELIREKMISDSIIESAPGTFFMIDQHSNLVRWNHFLQKDIGLPDEKLHGTSILETIHPDDRAYAAAKFMTVFATGFMQMDVRVQTRDRGIRRYLKTARRFMVDGLPYAAGFCVDVTERSNAEVALVREKSFSDALVESVPGAFYVMDSEGNYFRWNSYLNRLTGLKNSELQGRPTLLTFVESDRQLAAETMQKAFEIGVAQADLHVLTRDRGIRLFSVTARRFAVGEAIYLVGVGIDTTEWLAKVTNLEHDAQTDALTQIANRGHFLEMAQQEFDRCRRYHHSLSIWMLDIDYFKSVNDTYGHHAGDIALQSLVTTCRHALRDWDIIGRMGGEEFVVLLPETESSQALLVAERLRQSVATTAIPIGGDEALHLTVSIGVATAHEGDDGFDTLLGRADKALYEAKRTGRDKVTLAEHLSPSILDGVT